MKTKATVLDVVKRVFFLAYKACTGPVGMGHLQARSNVTEDDVWHNVLRHGDYPGDVTDELNPEEGLYADYVFGNMMKLHVQWTDEEVLDTSYQSWGEVYPSYASLVKAAIKSVESEMTNAN